MPNAEPKSFKLEPLPKPSGPAAASNRSGWWRGAALAASFAFHGLAIAALQFWPADFRYSGDLTGSEALTLAFQAPPEEPQPASEPEPEPAPPPQPEPGRPIQENQAPEPKPPELPVNLVVMNAPPTPQLRFQPAVELTEPSVEFPKPKEEPKTKPAKPAAPPTSSQQSKPPAKTIAARPTRTPSPVYPSSAVARKLEGTAVFALTIDTKGKVVGVDLVRSSGHASLDQAGKQGVRQWRFSPALRNGVAVASKLRAPVAFRLK